MASCRAGLYGEPTTKTLRVRSSWVRMFVDGREIPDATSSTTALACRTTKRDKPHSRRFRDRLGQCAARSQRYRGRLDEIAVWPTALSTPRSRPIRARRRCRTLLQQRATATPSQSKLGWLRTALLRALECRVRRSSSGELDRLRAELLASAPQCSTVMVMQEMATPRETHILLRGAYNAPGERSSRRSRGAARSVAAGRAEESSRPRAVADQAGPSADRACRGEPLLAANVRAGTREDQRQLRHAGRMAQPSRTAGLAGSRVRRSGWNVKALMRRMVLSATYRQDSAASPELFARDPENRLLARGPRFRLPAEIIRDQALSISGLLKNRLGGPSVYPYQPDGSLQGHRGRGQLSRGRSTSRARATISIAAACTRSGNARCRIRP